jgi:hypothetical protein
MTVKIQIKRSSVTGVTPGVGDISPGELAMNTTDKKLFSSNGSLVFELGSNLTNLTVSANLTVNAIIANGSIGVSGQVLSSNGSGVYWANTATGGGGGATLTANNTDSQTFFLPMTNTSSGTWSNAVVSTTKLNFVPSTGTLNATIFNALSDISLKKDVETISNALELVGSMRGVNFKWVDNSQSASGVIAQELESIAPELVSETNDIKNVNYDGIIAYLIEAIKDIKNRLDKANIK